MNEENLNPQDAPEITERAFEALNSGELEMAQELALQLEQLHFSSYFEIQALIYLDQDNREAAIAILREGVSRAAGAWPLWELLGNCLSDESNFEEALDCYAQGLALDIDEDVTASLQFNRATVLGRMKNHEEAWQIVDEISGDLLQDYPALRWRVEGFRLRTLANLNQCEQVLERANFMKNEISNENCDEHESFAVFWEQGGRALLQCGEIERAHQWALESLQEKRTYSDALELLRDTTPDLPEAARYFQVLLKGEFTDEDGEEMGFFTSFSVVARIAEEAEQLALQMESPRWDTPIHVVECQFVDECELQSIGVFDVGPYNCYPLNAEDEAES